MDVRELTKTLANGSRRSGAARGDSGVTLPDDLAANAAGGFLVLESCHSTWLFDTNDRRFCRVIRGLRAEPSVATDWRPYDRIVLDPDSDAFVVFLDASGTRLLRSWRHTAHCDQCGGEVTAEMSLEDLRRVARA